MSQSADLPLSEPKDLPQPTIILTKQLTGPPIGQARGLRIRDLGKEDQDLAAKRAYLMERRKEIMAIDPNKLATSQDIQRRRRKLERLTYSTASPALTSFLQKLQEHKPEKSGLSAFVECLRQSGPETPKQLSPIKLLQWQYPKQNNLEPPGNEGASYPPLFPPSPQQIKNPFAQPLSPNPRASKSQSSSSANIAPICDFKGNREAKLILFKPILSEDCLPRAPPPPFIFWRQPKPSGYIPAVPDKPINLFTSASQPTNSSTADITRPPSKLFQSSVSNPPVNIPPVNSSLFGNPPVNIPSANNPPVNNPPVNIPPVSIPPVNSSLFGNPPVNSSFFGIPPVKNSLFGLPPANLSVPKVEDSPFGTSPSPFDSFKQARPQKQIFANLSSNIFTQSPANNIFGSQSTSSAPLFLNSFASPTALSQPKEQEDESEGGDQPLVAQDNCNPAQSSGKYDYTTTKIEYKETAEKFKLNGHTTVLNVTVSLQRLSDKPKQLYIIIRMVNKCMAFTGIILKGTTVVQPLPKSILSLKVSKVLNVQDKKLAAMMLQFKEKAARQAFMALIQK